VGGLVLLVFHVLIPTLVYTEVLGWTGSRWAAIPVTLIVWVLAIGLGERCFRWARHRWFPNTLP
jgi:hypothetical protein